MGKVVGRRRGEAHWREAIAQHEASGLSVSAFCRRERINAGTLYGWRSRLRGREDKAAIDSAVVAPSAGFIELGELRDQDASWEVRLELGGGVILRLRRC